jgi:sugar/nucleoside kinase (ribokinase family)
VDTIGAGDSHAGGTLAGLARDGHWQTPFCWGMPWRPGWSATAAGIAPRLARNYSSHTKTYRSLRQ